MAGLKKVLFPIRSYLLAILLSIGLLVLRMKVLVLLPEEGLNSLLIFLVIVISAWYGGLGPGVFATVISVCGNGYFFGNISSVETLVLLAQGLLVSLLSSLLQRAKKDVTLQADLFSHIREVIVVTDENKKISFWNKGAENLYGYKPKEVLGKTIEDALGVKWKNQAEFHTTKNGKTIPVAYTKTKFQNKQGAIGTIVAIQDITKYKQKEDTLTGNLIKEQQAHKKTKNRYEKARDAIRARDQFLAVASHELKTPITSLLLHLQRVLQNILKTPLANFSGEQLVAMINNAQQQSNRLSQLITNLLDLSRITSGKLDLVLERVNLSEIAQNATEQIKKDGKIKNQIVTHIDSKIIGRWDKLRLEQVLINLLTNALKYGQEKKIEVTVEKEGSTARLVVADQGIGIAHTQLQRIFLPFRRASSKHNGESLGMGLYIVRQIVEAHKGKIHVVSRPKTGSRFIVELPIKSS